MDRDRLITQLTSLLTDFCKAQVLELVDLIYHYEGRDLVLRILVDRPQGGITMGECTRLNKTIGALLDEQNLIGRPYILEVSSPGIDRPLKSKSDFLRCVGKEAHFYLNMPVEGRIDWEGKILKVDDAAVHIEVKEKTIQIPLESINKAKQIIE